MGVPVYQACVLIIRQQGCHRNRCCYNSIYVTDAVITDLIQYKEWYETCVKLGWLMICAIVVMNTDRLFSNNPAFFWKSSADRKTPSHMLYSYILTYSLCLVSF
jgi:hypothetical protein